MTAEWGIELMICPWCAGITRPLFRQSKYICGRCNRPIVDCCDGEIAVEEKDDE
jgi:hypothetical protein